MAKAPGPKGERIIKHFDGTNPPEDFSIPSIGIEDIDRSIFHLFNEKLNFEVTHKGSLKKVPVIFAAGERFALTRRKNPIRDKNNTLILPVISIMQRDIDISPGQLGKGTAISYMKQPSYTIKYKLSKRDRKFQNIINKLGLKNQENVASLNNLLTNTGLVDGFASKPGTLATRRSDSGAMGASTNRGDTN